jgi:hypothetical protein
MSGAPRRPLSISGLRLRLGAKELHMEIVKKFGPYLAVELLLPGGTLIALLLYLARHRKFFPGLMSIFGPAVRLFT